MHELQKILLKRLSQRNNQRYSTLTASYDFDDNVVFHLRKLIEGGFIQKHDGIYSLTTAGLKEIAKYEPIELTDKGIKTFFIGFVCDDGEANFLLKAHPQAKQNFYNLPSVKPYFGEPIVAALVRGFQLNTDLRIEPHRFTYLSLHLKTIQNSAGEVIFDDAFAIYKVSISAAEKQKMQLMEAIGWFSKLEIENLAPKWPEVDSLMLAEEIEPYMSYTHVSDYIL